MINYTWTIADLERQVSDGLVTTAHWRVEAVDGEHVASTYGTYSWPDGVLNIPYENLTQADVLGWIWAQSEDWKDTVEASLAAQIEALKNPVQVTGVPW